MVSLAIRCREALISTENFVDKIGISIRAHILDRVSLLIIMVISALGVMLSLIQTRPMFSGKEIAILFIMVVYIVIAVACHKKYNLIVVSYSDKWVADFKNLHSIVKTIGIILVLVGFINLTNYIESYDGWNGFAILFYFCCYLHLTAIVKLLDWDDVLSASDSLMAVTLTMFVNFPKDKKNVWQSIVVFSCAFLLLTFKFSRPLTERVPMREEKKVKELVDKFRLELGKMLVLGPDELKNLVMMQSMLDELTTGIPVGEELPLLDSGSEELAIV